MPRPDPGVVVSPDVRFRRIEDEAVVVLQQTSEIMVVNDVGARLLELLRDGGCVAAAAETIAAEYGVERRRVAEDVAPYLEELRRHRVIV